MKLKYSLSGLMVFIGIIWALQGANIFQGSSFMTGRTEWLVAGVVCALLGSALLVFFRIRESNAPPPPPLEEFDEQ